MSESPTPHKQRVLRLLAKLGGKANSPEIDAKAENSVNAHLHHLREAGYVQSRPVLNGDGRKHIWELTDKGCHVVREQAAEWHAAALGIASCETTQTEGDADE